MSLEASKSKNSDLDSTFDYAQLDITEEEVEAKKT